MIEGVKGRGQGPRAVTKWIDLQRAAGKDTSERQWTRARGCANQSLAGAVNTLSTADDTDIAVHLSNTAPRENKPRGVGVGVGVGDRRVPHIHTLGNITLSLPHLRQPASSPQSTPYSRAFFTPSVHVGSVT
jgi:hypothetical protein